MEPLPYHSYIGTLYPTPFFGHWISVLPTFLYVSVSLALFGPALFLLVRDHSHRLRHLSPKSMLAACAVALRVRVAALVRPALRLVANVGVLAVIIGGLALHEASGKAPQPGSAPMPVASMGVSR